VVLLAVTVAAAPASAKSPLRCGNVRVDRTLSPDTHGSFGAFRIRATGTTCKAARGVASKYVLDANSVEQRAVRVGSWSCVWRPVNVAQQVNVTCSRRSARIKFVDKIPSG
jgi:hypothetical protein